ncbi:MAG: hypothetical protein IJH18_00910 [Bacilli bacterium]|nr:hypothetical protein [Bacilli bacterium]
MIRRVKKVIEEKKKNKLVGPFIIVLLLLLGCIGFILYDKGIILKQKEEPKTEKKEVKKEEKKEEKEEVLETTDKLLAELDKKYGTAGGCFLSKNDIFTGEKKDVNESFSNEKAFSMVFLDENPDGSISGEKVKEKIKEVFGKNYKFEHLKPDYSDCSGLKYDKTTDTYKQTGQRGCGGTCVYHDYIKIVKAIKKGNTLEVYRRVLFYDNTKSNSEGEYYSDYKYNNKVVTVNVNTNPNFYAELEQNISKGDLYKTVYKLEDDNYVYDYTEPVEE